MRKLGIILACILGLILLAGCQKKELPKFLVPSDANLIAEIQVGKLLADVDWEQVYAAIPGNNKPPTLSAALDELFNQTGIDVRTFTSATIFAKIPQGVGPVAEESYVGVILLGTFDQAKFIQNLKLTHGMVRFIMGEETMGDEFHTQSYEGYTLYLDEKEIGGFAFVGQDMFIGGTAPAVKNALSVAAGKKAALSGTLKETYDGLGAPLVKLALSLPGPLRQQMLQGMASTGMPFDFSSVVGVQMAALSFDKVGQDVSLLVKGQYDNAEAAQRAQSVIEGARLLFSPMIPIPELRSFLNKVQISKQESWVTLSLKTTVDEVKALLQSALLIGGQGQAEAASVEFRWVSTAITALMVDNKLTTIPTPVSANTTPCTTGTQDMTKFPDVTSTLAQKQTKWGGTWVAPDKVGYILFGHDIAGDGSATPTVNYVNFQKTTYCYTIDANGRVRQYDEAGHELTP